MSTSTRNRIAVWATAILTLTAASLRADQLQMQNGDRYAGKILSVTSNSIILESDVLGKVSLPRDKVSVLTFGATTPTNAAPAMSNSLAPAAAAPNAATTNTDLSAALRSLGANTNFIQQIRRQMLTGADPAANQKYDELVGGLMSGKLNLNDLRNQAQSSIDQINQLKRESGSEANDSLDSYLSILQDFVNETAPAQAPANFATNSPPASPTN
jgi:hypothetical protein